MIGRAAWLLTLGLAYAAAGCGPGANAKPRDKDDGSRLPPDQQDARELGLEIFDLVDRAVAYRASHQGRPATTLRQMGIESLTTNTVRRILNVQREPVVTVAFRRPDQRQILSCRGDSQILVEASVNGGRFTLMCSARSGDQRPMEIGELPEP
ncbi:MAG: hypothetical protein QOH59_358 [Gemmatimonadales bacterium]|jgi:hypothetical protein|nr:hypothetical protein [Gemmatimonadales bacterium]